METQIIVAILKVLFLAAIGGLIGWITNVMAIKMLFRPLQPVKIPILNLTLQGLIPKRRNDISKSIGYTVEQEIISISDIIDKVVTDENKSEVINTIKGRISRIIDSKIPTLVPSSIKHKIIEYIEEQIEKEGESILNSTIEGIINNTISRVNIGQMVEERINELELEQVEKMIFDISAKELKYIEVLGGVLGFAIGLVQGIIVLFI